MIDDLISHLESAANFYRGMALDPALPPHAKEALRAKARSLDEICEKAIEEQESSRDAAFEAVRKKLCQLPRYSFHLDRGNVRRVEEKSGNWIEFHTAHGLFDPASVDAAIGESL